MKGLPESRHTSSERRAPGLSSLPGARRERLSRVVRRRSAKHDHGSGQLTYLVMHLFELSGELIVRSDRRAVSFKERPSAGDDQAPSSTPRAERITPHAATSP